MAILKKFIGANTIGSEKIQLENDQSFFALNSSAAEVALFKLDGSNVMQFQVLPQVGSDPSAANDVVRKSYVDAEIASAGGDISALETRVQAIEDDYGVAGGLATLDGSGKIPTSQVPAIAITDVYVVADIAARDALTVEEGDVAKVSDAGAGLPKTYIYDGSSWIEIESGSDVDSVNGYTGVVVLATGDVAESGSTNLYYTPTRQAAIEAYADQAEADAISSANTYTDGQVDLLEAEDLTFLKLDGSRAMTDSLDMGGFTVTDTAGLTGETLSLTATVGVISLNGQGNASLSAGPSSEVQFGQGSKIARFSETSFDLDEVGIIKFAGASAINSFNISTENGDAMLSTNGPTGGNVQLESELADVVLLAPAGEVSIGATQLNMGSVKIVSLADGTVATDAATFGQVEAAESAANSYTDSQLDALSVQELVHESKTLVSGDITNGYVDVSFAIQGQPWVQVGRVSLVPGDDFTVSGSRITFAGSVASAGAEALEAGDKLSIFYMKEVQPYV
jgi:hypothetical protein